MSRQLDKSSMFQQCVLIGLWSIIRAVVLKQDIGARNQARIFRNSAIAFGDEFGLKGDDAKRIRRMVTYQDSSSPDGELN
jgi:hypothetical protein